MDNEKNMEVVCRRETPRPILPQTRVSHRFLSPTKIGVIGTLLVHALILPTAYFGIYGTKVPSRKIQEHGAFVNSNADAAEDLVLIALPTISQMTQRSSQAISSIPTLSKLIPVLSINPDPPAFLNLEVLTLGEDQTTKAAVEGGDGSEQARLFGIYTGQIQARIERIWRRPRTPVSEDNGEEAPINPDESFQCEAQIVQDVKGNVQEILMLRCNGSFAWQRSLVVAIQQSSPLPAPPSTKVFSRSITLDFLGLAYMPGSPDDDYEIASATMAQTNEESLRSAISPNPKQISSLPGDSLGSRN
jgi:hypothetical protein